jgi:glycosyl-4,4'-diaponeurosporenoate acyltransferase
MMRLVMSRRATFVADVVAWGALHAATGYAAHRLRGDLLSRDGWLLRERGFEDGGRWYLRRLRVASWKDRLPEAGGLFPGGISKRRLPAVDEAGLAVFIRETRRAELAHWAALASGPLLTLWNPPLASALLVGYGVGVNLPFIVVQRYNRLRALAVLRRRAASRRHAG